MNIQSILGTACATMTLAVASVVAITLPAQAHGGTETATPNFQRPIPNIPGKSLTAVVVEYPPGTASHEHKHAASAFIYAYVVSGDIESQVNDGPKRIYHAGESFYEEPGAVHRVSRNASVTKPAKLLAVFIADSDEKALTIPIK
ncbi:cupin domain-containing protein [Cupriavidus sp. Marseille-Q8015]